MSGQEPHRQPKSVAPRITTERLSRPCAATLLLRHHTLLYNMLDGSQELTSPFMPYKYVGFSSPRDAARLKRLFGKSLMSAASFNASGFNSHYLIGACLANGPRPQVWTSPRPGSPVSLMLAAESAEGHATQPGWQCTQQHRDRCIKGQQSLA